MGLRDISLTGDEALSGGPSRAVEGIGEVVKARNGKGAVANIEEGFAGEADGGDGGPRHEPTHGWGKLSWIISIISFTYVIIKLYRSVFPQQIVWGESTHFRPIFPSRLGPCAQAQCQNVGSHDAQLHRCPSIHLYFHAHPLDIYHGC